MAHYVFQVISFFLGGCFVEFYFVIFGGYVLRVFWWVGFLWSFLLLFLVDMFLGFFGWWVFVEFSFVIFGGYVLRIFWLVDVLWNF